MARKPRAAAAKKPEPIEDLPSADDADDDAPTIAEFDQNLDDVEPPELLPEGHYVGEVQEVKTPVSQKGNRYYSIQFLIPPEEFPPHYDVDNYPDGVRLYYNLLTVPQAGDRRAIHRVREFMEKLGLSTATNVIDTSEWLNQTAKLRVRHSSYQGNRREEIQPNGIERAD